MAVNLTQSLAALHDLIKTAKHVVEYAHNHSPDPGNRNWFALVAKLELLVRLCEGIEQ